MKTHERGLGPALALMVITIGVMIGIVEWIGPARAQTVTVELRNGQGAVVGHARLSQEPGGVRLQVEVSGLAPGLHGFHIHAVGQCEPPAFTSAGPHFNPEGKQHGHKNPAGPHAGDLPNLMVGPDGSGRADLLTADVTLAGGSYSLFQPAGTSLVIHADPDDEQTDPAGNSGARVACGVITR
jgi:Cu-Zn family superoxide dismutase